MNDVHYNPTSDLIKEYNSRYQKCGAVVSVTFGWMCSRCGLERRSTNEVWAEQGKCKGRIQI